MLKTIVELIILCCTIQVDIFIIHNYSYQMTNTFDSQRCTSFIEKQFTESALPSLVKFVAIDNMSKAFYSQQDWSTLGWQKLETAANHVASWIKNSGINGLTLQIISDKAANLTPLIFVEIKGEVDETFLFYGHYDKQPPFEGWNQGLGAYTPVLYPSSQNPEKLYGRGGADDGYSSYGSILAIKALQDQGIPIPRTVLLIEGDEETSSGDVEKHIQNLKERIGTPKLIFCLDSGALDYQRLWITSSLRGMARVTVRVDTIPEGVHSGTFSGLIPSSFRILRSLIERLQDQETGYVDKALQVDVPPNRYKELYDLAAAKGVQAIRPFQVLGQLKRQVENVLQSLLLNGWKPQLSVIGLRGLPEPQKAGNVLLPYAEATLSIRLPPTKNKEEAKNYIIKRLTENPPYDAKVTVINPISAEGFNSPQYPPLLESVLHEASQTYYGKSKLALAEGASIPFMGFLSQIWPKAQFVITGVLGPGSNAHGPNEFLHIPYLKKLICSIAHVLAKTVGKLP